MKVMNFLIFRDFSIIFLNFFWLKIFKIGFLMRADAADDMTGTLACHRVVA